MNLPRRGLKPQKTSPGNVRSWYTTCNTYIRKQNIRDNFIIKWVFFSLNVSSVFFYIRNLIHPIQKNTHFIIKLSLLLCLLFSICMQYVRPFKGEVWLLDQPCATCIAREGSFGASSSLRCICLWQALFWSLRQYFTNDDHESSCCYQTCVGWKKLLSIDSIMMFYKTKLIHREITGPCCALDNVSGLSVDSTYRRTCTRIMH